MATVRVPEGEGKLPRPLARWKPSPLSPIADGELALTFGRPTFVPLTAEHLGNAISDADGFDVSLAAIAGNFAGEEGETPLLDSHLTAASFTDGAVAGEVIAPAVKEAAGVVAANTPAIDKLGTWLGVASAPAGATGGAGGTGSSGSGGSNNPPFGDPPLNPPFSRY